ncbi:MAG: hypothetical protein CHKLHMKO_00662 [Candidatus Argoarchaeum ethanivorans]|uniref:Uncharacterized protein n=1 Tax=Candidatus Argoarchaeum ethanivorans TaxID=2608793 RepID=A0A811TET0_9EURY|nr:MAG: hypothetical protein CHKLHMKO_00662 [Candidatus Argoarchaeum ethanivorans]
MRVMAFIKYDTIKTYVEKQGSKEEKEEYIGVRLRHH